MEEKVFRAIEQDVEQAIEAHSMLCPGDLVVVGVSGGPDSLGLLVALSVLSPRLGLTLHVAHLNHRLRGPAADADARFVADVAYRLGLPATVAARDVSALQAERHLSLEDAAREARYAFFAEVVAATGARGVAVGHTADDQLETILLHWLRGAGLAGLRGMRPVSDLRLPVLPSATPLRVYRPLLGVSRAEVARYCQERGLAPRQDESNQDPRFLRNRVRHEAIPILESLNPRLRESVLRMARVAAEDDDYLEAQTREAAERLLTDDGRGVAGALHPWRALPPSLQSRVLRESYARVVGDLADLGADHVLAAREALTAGRTGAAVDWPRRVRVRLGYDAFRVSREAEPAALLPAEDVALVVPGETQLAGVGLKLIARVQDRACEGASGRDHVDLDYDLAGQDLVTRRRRPGDRIIPLGMAGEKKLQDLMVDAKVPREKRDAIPVVASKAGILWVAGLRADDRFKVTAATRAVLCLRVVRLVEGADR